MSHLSSFSFFCSLFVVFELDEKKKWGRECVENRWNWSMSCLDTPDCTCIVLWYKRKNDKSFALSWLLCFFEHLLNKKENVLNMSVGATSTVNSNIFPRVANPGFSNMGPVPNNPNTLPIVTGTNLPPNNMNNITNLPPNYPSLQQSFGLPNSVLPNNYGLATGAPPPGSNPVSFIEKLCW